MLFMIGCALGGTPTISGSILSIVSSGERPGATSTIIPEVVSGFPAGGVIPGDGFLCMAVGELVLETKLDFPFCPVGIGVLGPPFPTDKGPVTGEGTLM